MIKLDLSKYKTYKFSDMVLNISEHVEPSDTDLDTYIGLEHLDPECIHIRRRGIPSDVKRTKLRVYPGDIIFGKRRAYQRKAGLVDFDGICSAHAMVVRANPKVILPELFPFFMHSDLFMYRAVDISEGSLSPTIKWKIIAEEEFKLLPLDEQKRLADLLWSVDDTIEGWIKVLNQTEILIQSHLKEKLKSYHVSEVKIKNILEKNSKFKVGKVPQNEYLNEGEYPIIDQSKTWIAGYSDNEELVYVGELPVLVFGDHTTEIKYVDFPFILGADGTKVICPKPNIKARYLFYVIRDLNLKPVGYRRHFAILRDRKIKVPNIDKQNECIEELDYLFNKKALQEHYILNLKNIQKQIINQLLE